MHYAHLAHIRHTPPRLMTPCGCAAAVLWIGLRRGWWLSLISYILKLINSKGKPKSQKKKRKSKHKKKEGSSKAPEPGDGTEAWSGLVDSSTAAAADGGAAGAAAAAAKALSNSMRTKRKSGRSETAGDTAQRESLSLELLPLRITKCLDDTAIHPLCWSEDMCAFETMHGILMGVSLMGFLTVDGMGVSTPCVFSDC